LGWEANATGPHFANAKKTMTMINRIPDLVRSLSLLCITFKLCVKIKGQKNIGNDLHHIRIHGIKIISCLGYGESSIT
jgi:hypothetical protein